MSDRFLAPSDVLRKFDGTRVTRDLLYRWAIKRWIDAQQVDRGDNHAYVYPESGLWKIGRLAWAYALGLEPNHAERFATEINEDSATRENDFLRDEFEKVFNAVASITETALSLTCDLQPLSDRALQLLEAEHCAVFLVPGEEYRNARNPARHMEKQAETPRRDLCGGFELHDRHHGGLLGGLARTGELVALHGGEITGHQFRAGTSLDGVESHCRSLLIVPIFDRKSRLRGCVTFQNKQGKFGYFTPFDEVIARMVAGQIMIGLEKLELMAATTTVLAYGADQLKLPVYLARLLQHAIKLVGGDYGDIFWVIDDRNFAVVAQQGQSNIKMGDTPPSPSVARRVAESRKPVLIPDVTDKNRFPYYANCRADVRGEVAIPMLLRDFRQGARCVAVLNVESTDFNAFDEHDVAVLEYLATHAIPEIEAVQRRDEIYKSLEQIFDAIQRNKPLDHVLTLILRGLLHSGFDRGRLFTYEEKGRHQQFRCICSVGRKERDGRHAGVTVDVDKCRYAQRTVHKAKLGHPRPEIRTPGSKDFPEPDPCCKALHKNPNLPWIVYPLLHDHGIFGYIAVDNHVTGDPLTPTMLENLRLFGALATQATSQYTARRQDRREASFVGRTATELTSDSRAMQGSRHEDEATRKSHAGKSRAAHAGSHGQSKG